MAFIARAEEAPDEFHGNRRPQGMHEVNDPLIDERAFAPARRKVCRFKPATIEEDHSVHRVVVVAARHFGWSYFFVYSNLGVLSTNYTANCGFIFAGYNSW